MTIQFTLEGEHSEVEISVESFPNGIGWIAYSPKIIGNNGIEYEAAHCIDESAGSFTTEHEAQKDAIEWFSKYEVENIESENAFEWEGYQPSTGYVG